MRPDAEHIAPTVTFTEHRERTVTRMIGFSHLSIEVGHAYMEDFREPDRLRAQLQRVAAWARAAESMADSGTKKPRVSTCFLIDDYFRQELPPAEAMDILLSAARKAGVRIDYVAREAACAVSGDVRLAELVAARLISEPAPGTNGSQPPVEESGRLRMGDGFRGFGEQAMQERAGGAGRGTSRRNRAVSLDVELWHDADRTPNSGPAGPRMWSCPFLAAVWQLLRLGAVRNHGEPVSEPTAWDPAGPWPARWDEMPALTRINPHAKPFAAYRSVSVVPHTFMAVEDAVRLIIARYSVEPDVRDATESMASRDGVTLPRAVGDRLTHVFIEGR